MLAIALYGANANPLLTGSSTAQDHSEQTAALLQAAGVEGVEIIRVPEAMTPAKKLLRSSRSSMPLAGNRWALSQALGT